MNRDYMAFLDAQRREAAARHDAAREAFAAQLSGVNDTDPGNDWAGRFAQEDAARHTADEESQDEARDLDAQLAAQGDADAYLRLLGLAGGES